MLFREPPVEPDIAEAHARVMGRARTAIAAHFALSPRWSTTSNLSVETQLTIIAEGTKSAINGLAAWWWDHRDVARDEVEALAMDLLFVGIERLLAPE